MESVFRIAESGDGYLAVERSSFVLRKLKRENKIDEAIDFLIKLAHKLGDAGQWPAASVAALHSIETIPKDAKTILTSIKRLMFNFIERAPPEAATPEFFTYAKKYSEKLGDRDHFIFKKKFDLAFETKQYTNVHCILFVELSTTGQMIEPEIDFNDYIRRALVSQWDWISTLPQEDRDYTGQFIMGRFLLSMLGTSQNGYQLYDFSSQAMRETKPEGITDEFFEQPIMHFVSLFANACLRQNSAAATNLYESYKPILETDSEFKKWFDAIKSIYCTQNQEQNVPNFGNIFQNVFRMFQPQQN
ncbi:hypothetical protein TVAG_277010 [Trichomonas vaginalis G3]|uniref:Uncharacterized protein n=1 Tax=Trichomonas vaginalis (strain ATCC PRA-98 / G3) TaxID=412133 RepID=A2FP61_TRIV3|nr:Golgi to ER traffic protein 4-like protein family [Trichomonas vaginalis G3]EAX93296.1 hypothetical protein TVAG_277010 [Trichomonas vaginalis G3]KAI5547493.1 Golgi to ER traffic protein 4-like protein family [Trichomonas vaginalis G3]|eukprot:XP_001306226.1 hypothetical protein [Trichomonas vaginalis G3]